MSEAHPRALRCIGWTLAALLSTVALAGCPPVDGAVMLTSEDFEELGCRPTDPFPCAWRATGDVRPVTTVHAGEQAARLASGARIEQTLPPFDLSSFGMRMDGVGMTSSCDAGGYLELALGFPTAPDVVFTFRGERLAFRQTDGFAVPENPTRVEVRAIGAACVVDDLELVVDFRGR